MKIIISGTSGVGKSTTVGLLKELYLSQGKEVKVLSELVVESPFFDKYFENITEWWLPAALDFLMSRFNQWFMIEKEFENKDPKDYVIIYDRFFVEDLIFAELREAKHNKSALLNEAFIMIYDELWNKFKEFEKPDFFILLRASFDKVKERQFGIRGREQEDSFDTKYWQDLYYRYYASDRYRTLFQETAKNFLEFDSNGDDPQKRANDIASYIEKRMN